MAYDEHLRDWLNEREPVDTPAWGDTGLDDDLVGLDFGDAENGIDLDDNDDYNDDFNWVDSAWDYEEGRPRQ